LNWMPHAHHLWRCHHACTAVCQVLSAEPNNAKAHFRMGQALQGMGEWEKARGCYAKVLELEPQSAEARAAVVQCNQAEAEQEEKARKFEREMAERLRAKAAASAGAAAGRQEAAPKV
jgi:tetratricopeptide (TPR) repeat protein